MKNFLKSFAIFACSALLLGACTEEDTVDGSGEVMSPTITSIQGGNEKLQVSWTVPTGNPDVNSCQIKWLGGTTDVSGTYNYTVEEGGEYTFTIEPKHSSGGTLPADTYGITLQTSVTITGESSLVVVSSAVVYDSSTYEGKLPTPALTAVSEGIQVEWSNVDAECEYVEVTYRDIYNVETIATTKNMTNGATTILADAMAGKSITYNAYFKPADGLEGSYVALDGTAEIPASIVGPTMGSVTAGKERMIVTFSMPADNFDTDVDYAVVKYGDTEVKLTKDAGLVAGDNVFEITSVAAGEYEVVVYSVDLSGFPSDADDFSELVIVYDDATYADSLPSVKSMTNIDDKVEITLYKLPSDCIKVEVSYETAIGNSTVSLSQEQIEADERVVTIASGAKEGSDIKLTAIYMPSYAIGDAQDQVSIAGKDSAVVPYITPAQPTDLVVSELGYNSGVSTIAVAWTSTSIYAEKTIVYYGDGKSVELAGDVTECTLSTDSEIEVGELYNIYVELVNVVDDSTSNTSVPSDSISATAYGAETYSEASLESGSMAIATTSTGAIEITWFGVADLSAVTVTYNGFPYPAVQAGDDFIATFAYSAGVDIFSYVAEFQPTVGAESFSGTVPVVVSNVAIETTDVAPVAPTNVTAQAGVEADASVIYVSWTQNSNSYGAQTNVYVEKGGSIVKTIENATSPYTVTTTDGIVTDTEYSVYVKTTNNYGLFTDAVYAEGTITTYNTASYSAPAAEVHYVDGTPTISWGDAVVTDIKSMSVSYLIGGVSTSASAVIEGGVISSIAMTGADAGSSVTYTATFCPEGGATDVVKSGTADIPAVATAENLTATPNYDGSSSIVVAWDQKAVTGATKVTTMLYYTGNTDGVDVSSYVANEVGSYTIATTADQKYEIYLTVTTDSNSAIESATVSTTAYGESTYAAASNFPTVASITNNSGSVVVEWSDYDDKDIVSVVVTPFGGTAVTTAYTDLAKGTTITKGSADTFTYSVNFCPEGATGSVAVAEGSSYDIPVTVPSSPASLVLASDSDGSVDVSWTLPSASDITKVVVTYNGTALADLAADATSTTLSMLDVDKEYEIVVTTYNGTVACATPVSGTIATYNTSSYGADDLPTVTAEMDSKVISFVWSDIDADLQSVQVTYNGTTQTAVSVSNGTITMPNITGASESVLTFSYVASFYPTGGKTPVTVTSSANAIKLVADYVIENDGSYTIYTAAGLKTFADAVNGGSTSLNATLADDIDLADLGATTNWTPIGDNATSDSYSGIFDGADYTISNLYIVGDQETYISCRALFGLAKGATIKNVTLDNPYIQYAGSNSAALVGRVTSSASTIENCHITGENGLVYGVDTSVTSANYSYGSIAGSLESASIITGCSSSITVENYNSSNTTYHASAGGLVGGISGNSYVVNSEFSGTVYGVTSVGGIVARSGGGYIVGCVNRGEVHSTSSYTGGMVGRVASATYIVGCANTGLIATSATTANTLTGGITGRNAGGYVIGCYATGAVTTGASSPTTVGIVSGNANTTGQGFSSCYYYVDSASSVSSAIGTIVSGDTTTASDTILASSLADLNSETAVTALNTAIASVTACTVDYKFQVSTTGDVPVVVAK